MLGSFVEFKRDRDSYQGIILDKFKDIAYYEEANREYARHNVPQPIYHIVDYYLIRLNNSKQLFKVKPSEITEILNYVR